MRLWKRNRLDSEYNVKDTDIINGFFKSKYFTSDMTIHRGLLLYISMPDGLDSTLDTSDINILLSMAGRDDRRWNK
jgi:hypothetical protein